MSEFLSWMPSSGWQRLMLDALWQSTLVAGVGLIATRALSRRAAARAWVLLLALSACVVVPLASWAARSAGWTLLPAIATESGASHRMARVSVDASLPSSEDSTLSASRQGVVSARDDEFKRPVADSRNTLSVRIDWMTLIAVAWLAASLLLLMRLMLSVAALGRLVRRGAACQDEHMATAAAAAARRVGLTQPPRLLLSERVTMPLVLALGRPTILLPASECAEMGEMNWTAVFAHELGHVVRRDGWSRLWVQWIAIVLPLSPLVSLARRAFFAACEEACDDIAVAAGSDPIDLAATLTAWIDRVPRTSMLVAIGMSSTKARTLRLLALRTTPLTGINCPARWMTVAATMCIVIATAAMQTRVTAEQQAGAGQVREVIGGQDLRAQPELHADGNAKAGPPRPQQTKIAGLCVDEKGTPIVGAQLKLFAANFATRAQWLLMEVETNEQGQYGFSIGDMPDLRAKEVGFIVIAQAAGKATATSTFFRTGEGGESNFKLPPAGKINGRVIDAAGRPVTGAIVMTNDGGLFDPVPGVCSTVTDAEGRYELADLHPFDLANEKPQPAGNGMFMIRSECTGWVVHPNFARTPFKYKIVPSAIDVTLAPLAVVEGKVLLANSGQAIRGARLEFWNDSISPDWWTRTTVDELGEYRLSILPPGTYRVSVVKEGFPNLFRLGVELKPGANRLDLEMEVGGVVKGRVIDAETEKPVVLAEGEQMSISQNDGRGRSYAGMGSAPVKPDGTYALALPPGHHGLGIYVGPNWLGVNTDRLYRNGVDIVNGQTVEMDVHVRRLIAGKPAPHPLPEQRVTQASEREAAAAINRLGGWVVQETVDGAEHVVEVNMVWHQDERLGRLDNYLMTDECLSHVQAFTKLKRLMLKGTQASDAGLARLRGMESLEWVSIWDGSAVTDSGAAHLATLPNLTRLNLSNAALTDESLRHFSRLPKIEWLLLQGNQISDRGLAFVKDMTQLKQLGLGASKLDITDDGLKHVS